MRKKQVPVRLVSKVTQRPLPDGLLQEMELQESDRIGAPLEASVPIRDQILSDIEDYLRECSMLLAALAREEERLERLKVLSHLEDQARQLGIHAVLPNTDDPLDMTDSDDSDSPV